jgi:hypothetical protein
LGLGDRAAPLVAARAQPIVEPVLRGGKECVLLHWRRRHGGIVRLEHAPITDEGQIDQQIVVQMMIEVRPF